MAMRSIAARLDDILDNITYARLAIGNRTWGQYAEDPVIKLAVERALEIISEASRHIPEEDKARYPEVPWQRIRAIGNVLRHEYDRIDTDIIWDTATVHLQNLEPIITKMRDDVLMRELSATNATRIDRRFAALKSEGRAALVTFITAGDPDLETSAKILAGLPAAGADIIELGMPFSDPMADGPAIQAASLRALKAGQTMQKTLAMVKAFRASDDTTPVVLMGYYNPIYVFPTDRFLAEAKAAGVDGLIVVDVPPEADDELCLPAMQHGLNFIRLATPTTDARRLPAVLNNTSGFLYYVSIAGITGTAAPDATAVHQQVKRIKSSTALPVVVGFGVKTPQQAKAIAQGADGVVVGSALVGAIEQSLSPEGKATSHTASAVLDLVKDLAAALQPA